jgi:hypothetical protein
MQVYLILDGVSIIPPQYMESIPRKGEQIERDTLFYEVTQTLTPGNYEKVFIKDFISYNSISKDKKRSGYNNNLYRLERMV